MGGPCKIKSTHGVGAAVYRPAGGTMHNSGTGFILSYLKPHNWLGPQNLGLHVAKKGRARRASSDTVSWACWLEVSKLATSNVQPPPEISCACYAPDEGRPQQGEATVPSQYTNGELIKGCAFTRGPGGGIIRRQ